MFGTFEILAGDFAKGKNAQFTSDTFILPLLGSGKILIPGTRVQIKASQIEELSVATEENMKRMGGTIGWGIVGGLALGGIGLLAGILAGGRSKEVTFVCKSKDGRKLFGKCDQKIFTQMQAACF